MSTASRIYDATWGRGFAAGYDWFLSASEEAGLREFRTALLAEASGDVVEIGSGTGVNLELYPEEIASLTLTEPFGPMASQLHKKLAGSDRAAQVHEAPADAIPLADDSADTAVSTLVLCTVPDQAAALGELKRVLRPGGRLLFLEHVRSEDEKSARWQDRLHGPWKLFGHGCNCNCDTLAAIRAAGFKVERVERDEFPKSLPITKPLIIGSALAPA